MSSDIQGNLNVYAQTITQTLNVVSTANIANIYTSNIVGFVGSQWTGPTGSTIYYVPNVGVGTSIVGAKLQVQGNIYVSNALTTTNVVASLMNVSTLNVSTIENVSTMVVSNNVYVANALTTNNFFSAGITSNASTTLFNYDTLTIPFINSTTNNVSSIANINTIVSTSLVLSGNNASIVLTGGGTGNAGFVTVLGNIYASNALTTTNVVASLMNVSTLNVSTIESVSTLVVSKNVYVANTLSTTNVFATSVVPTYPLSFRNRIINGDFIVDQRNSGSSTTPSATLTRVIDRWNAEMAGSGRCTVGQNLGAIVSSPAGLANYYGMRVTTTTTPGPSDYFFIDQTIEGINVVDLVWGQGTAKPATLSFWVYSSLTGTGGGFIRNAGESSGNYTRSYPFSYVINSTNTWEYKTVVIPGDTTGQWLSGQTDGPQVGFEMWNGTTYQNTAGAWAAGNYTGPSNASINYAGTLNSNLYITGIQFESGPFATPFERRPMDFTMAQCQRYYEPTIARVGGYNVANAFLRGSVYFNTKKRPKASPTFTVISQLENNNLNVVFKFDNSNYDQSSARFLSNVLSTGDAYGQWKVSVDCEF